MATKNKLSVMRRELSQPDIPEPYTAKIKATHNLSPKVLASLEIGQSKLRGMLDPKIRGKLNRSLIVELAVKAVMADFAANGSKSQLYRDAATHFSVSTD